MSGLFRWVGLLFLLLHFLDILPIFIRALEERSFVAGNIRVTLYELARVLILKHFFLSITCF